MPSELSEETLELIIRFTASISDLTLQIDSPKITSTLGLKQLIRQNLPVQHANDRLRLISSGKILEDAVSLHQSLGLKTPPPLSKVKGKEPIRNNNAASQQRYIHCSLGDTLSASSLAAEAEAAETSRHSLLANLSTTTTTTTNFTVPPTHNPSENTPNPQGFDRLLSTGFTPSDIATLRASFLTHLSYTHTPDTLPHGELLRRLEERWLDTDTTNNSADDTEIALDDDEAGMLDDIFWGNVFGFFWPVGAVVWGWREEGVWTRRRKYLVAAGVLTNVFFGFARLISARE